MGRTLQGRFASALLALPLLLMLIVPTSARAAAVYDTAAAYDSVNNRYLVVYARESSVGYGDFDIYGQFVDSGGAFIGTEFQITTDSGDERYPAVAFDPVNQRYLVVNAWYTDGTLIQSTLLNWDGTVIDSRSHSSTGGDLASPSVAFNARNQRYLIAWEEKPTTDATPWDIWGHILDADAADVAADFRISGAVNDQLHASVAADSLDGTFLVAFDDDRGGTSVDVYGQLVLDNGSLLGTADNVNVVISDGALNQRRPKASFDPATRRFVVAWQDERNAGSSPDVYGQFLDNTGAAVSANFAVSTNASSQAPPVVAYVPSSSAYLLAWHDGRDLSNDSIYGQVLLSDGTPSGANIALVPAADNAVTQGYAPGIAANTTAPQALLSFAADPTADPAVGARLGVRIIGAPPLPGAVFQVLSTAPDNGATGVATSTAIAVTFNMPINPSSVGPSGVSVVRTSDSAVVAGSLSVSPDNTIVTFTPDAALDNNTSYTVTLSGDGISAEGSGDILESDYVFSFTTTSGSSANSVVLFFRDTPGIFGCSVAPGKTGWRDGVATLALIFLPAAAYFLGKRRRAAGGRRLGGFLMVLASAAMILSAGPARAGSLGPPQPSVSAGKFGAQLGYFYTEDMWEPDTATAVSGGTTVFWETDKVKQNSIVLKGIYGLSSRCEASVKVGVADRAAPQGFDGSYAFLAGAGAKGILYGRGAFAVGPVLDFTWYANQEEDIAFGQGGNAWRGKESIEGSWDLQAGLALQAALRKATLYGGPSFYWSRADVNYRITDGIVALDVKNSYTQKSVVGGFAGVRFPLSDRLQAEVEGQYRSDFSAGATLLYAF